MHDNNKRIFIGKFRDLEYETSVHLFFIAQDNCLMILFSVIKIDTDLNCLLETFFVTVSHNISLSIYPYIIKMKYPEE